SSAPPAGFFTFAPDAVVTIRVSGVAVPDVVGLTVEEAAAVLAEAGTGWELEVSSADPGSCPTPPGEHAPETVACQIPAAGTVIAQPDTVTLVLFPPPAPEPSESPDPSGTPTPDPSPTATSAAASGWDDPGLLVPLATEAPVPVCGRPRHGGGRPRAGGRSRPWRAQPQRAGWMVPVTSASVIRSPSAPGAVASIVTVSPSARKVRSSPPASR